jgi:hypothetical protein
MTRANDAQILLLRPASYCSTKIDIHVEKYVEKFGIWLENITAKFVVLACVIKAYLSPRLYRHLSVLSCLSYDYPVRSQSNTSCQV